MYAGHTNVPFPIKKQTTSGEAEDSLRGQASKEKLLSPQGDAVLDSKHSMPSKNASMGSIRPVERGNKMKMTI